MRRGSTGLGPCARIAFAGAWIYGAGACAPRAPAPPQPALADATTDVATTIAPTQQPPEAPLPTRPAWPAANEAEDAHEVLALEKGQPPRRLAEDDARREGLLVVDLSDGWSPFLFSDRSGPNEASKPNTYRPVFVDLANERRDAEGNPLPAGQHLYLEPFGIPPTLGVLATRAEEALQPARTACLRAVDTDGLRAFTGTASFLDREDSLRQLRDTERDEAWLAHSLSPDGGAAMPPDGPTEPALTAFLRDAPPKVAQRVLRWRQGRARLRAVKAVQARLRCEGMLTEKVTPGHYDLATHSALAIWERKNDIFGWGILGGETLAALLRPPRELEAEALRRFFAERVADAAGIVEDGSASRADVPATYVDPQGGTGGGTDSSAESGTGGTTRPVPNLIEDHVRALVDALGVATPEDALAFLRQAKPESARLRVAIRPPPLPAYYAEPFSLEVQIDRGDVWYDFVFDRKGKPINQPRNHYPHLTLFAHWRGQRIPLVDWRTTIGSWRSEKAANGFVYYRYKSSDVGPRIWKNIVAAPTWIPPEGTVPQDLLVRRVRDRQKGPELEVNTAVMGPGFQSAYGLAMAIHLKDGGFDNQIRTHGSVDYTSIARRFSHGCHRLVNNRAVRLFDFVLRRQATKRIGQVPLAMHRQLFYQGRSFPFQLATRGYYYELVHPIPVNVLEGRIQGRARQPLGQLMHKPGVSYAGADDLASGDASANTNVRIGESVGATAGATTDTNAKDAGPAKRNVEPDAEKAAVDEAEERGAAASVTPAATGPAPTPARTLAPAPTTPTTPKLAPGPESLDPERAP